LRVSPGSILMSRMDRIDCRAARPPDRVRFGSVLIYGTPVRVSMPKGSAISLTKSVIYLQDATWFFRRKIDCVRDLGFKPEPLQETFLRNSVFKFAVRFAILLCSDWAVISRVIFGQPPDRTLVRAAALVTLGSKPTCGGAA